VFDFHRVDKREQLINLTDRLKVGDSVGIEKDSKLIVNGSKEVIHPTDKFIAKVTRWDFVFPCSF
jgi:hypothetical protein